MMKGTRQMANKIKSTFNLKPICSVADMALMLGLSRARFYQLLEQGIFPQPVYCTRTKRPLYTLELQKDCLAVKETNVGYNGQYILFYSPRKEKAEAVVEKSVRHTRVKNTLHDEFAQTLVRMGVTTDAAKVGSAIEELYPDGIEDKEHGVIIRELFRYFKGL
jgi:hypothetical protein